MSRFTQAEIDALRPSPEDGAAQPEREKTGEEAGSLYHCPSCGAEVVTDATTAATLCYYCHNPVVLAGRLDGRFTPDQIIPFAIDKEKAVGTFMDWTKKKRFIPKAFFSKKQIDMLTGVYFPFWMISCAVRGAMTAKATKVRSWRTGSIQHTETEHYDVIREGALHFTELTKNALKKADEKLTTGVQPYDFSALTDFSMGYLSGFQAEKRDIETKDLEPELEEEIRGYSASLLKESAEGYTTVQPSYLQAVREKTDYRYTLFPVWILTYLDQNKKTYFYAMNGQTGKVCGVLPLDFKRLLGLFFTVALPLFLLLVLGGYLL
jgi:DNA-directed RNA polymerase subunit RPC12/RpoP